MTRCELPDGPWQISIWEEDPSKFPCQEWEVCPDCADEDEWFEPECWVEYVEPDIGFSCEHCGLRVVDENDYDND